MDNAPFLERYAGVEQRITLLDALAPQRVGAAPGRALPVLLKEEVDAQLGYRHLPLRTAALYATGYERWSSRVEIDGAPVEVYKGLGPERWQPAPGRFAQRVSVTLDRVILDEGLRQLVLLSMVGTQTAIRANGAALNGGNRVHTILHRSVELKKKQHTRLDARLPKSGAMQRMLIHNQLSLVNVDPTRPHFYLLGDGPIPDNFMPLLNRTLPVPILTGWGRYLWRAGLVCALIEPLQKAISLYGWRVKSEPDSWAPIIEAGLKEGLIDFDAAGEAEGVGP